jgi:hypothetical protein
LRSNEMETKQGSWKKERATGRKYSGGDADTRPAAGERDKYWVSGYTRADGKKIAGYWRTNPDAKNPDAHR